jgi:hypothetical protein
MILLISTLFLVFIIDTQRRYTGKLSAQTPSGKDILKTEQTRIATTAGRSFFLGHGSTSMLLLQRNNEMVKPSFYHVL